MRIGIDLGGSHIGLGLVEGEEILEKKVHNFSSEEKIEIESFLEKWILEALEQLLQNIDKNEVKQIGVSTPGVIQNGSITKTTNLNINCFPITKILQQLLPVPVLIENDGRCAALAEKQYGNLKDFQNGIFLSLGTGIGAGVFLQGKLIRQIKRIGHVIIHPQGRKCNCGKQGCFEAYCSMKAFKKQIRDKEQKGTIPSKEIVKMLQDEKYDGRFDDIVQEYIEDLAIQISNLINLFSSEKLVIGGSFVYYETILFPKLKARLDKPDLSIRIEKSKIGIAKFQNEAGIIGAANLEKVY